MERPDERNDDGFESLADATGMEGPNAQPAMGPGADVSDEKAEDEAGGDEKTAVEGASGMAATQRAWGGQTTDIQGGAGTHVPAEGDEHMGGDAPDERKDSSDPRGH